MITIECDDAISRKDAEQMFRNIRSHLKPQDYKSAEEFNTRDLMLLNAEQMIHALPSVTQSITRDIEKSNFSQEQYLLDTDSAYRIGYEQGKKDGRRKGHWIETEYHRWKCSVCREKGMSEWDNIHDVRTNFCPNCGAKMKSEE